MSRLREYRGYTHGQLVQARYQPEPNELAGDWRDAVFVCGDSDDAELPFAVKWGDGEPEDIWDYSDWIRSGNIRKRSAAQQAVRWQYRTRSDITGMWDCEWQPVTAGVFASDEVADKIEFREAPERTDAEKISAALAAYKASEPFPQVIDILEGNA